MGWYSIIPLDFGIPTFFSKIGDTTFDLNYMKRRKAIQNMAIVSSSLLLLPGCQVGESLPTYSNIPLEGDDRKFLKRMINAILPQGENPVSTPETTSHFILTMVNDCYKPKEITKFVRGMKLFEQHIKDDYQESFQEMNDNQYVLLFTEVTNSPIFPKSMKYFLSTTKSLTVRHYTTSQYFLKEKMDWEFAPGRYLGFEMRKEKTA